jgi:membrane peptidoglycan carboxypeptidase
MNMMIIFVCFVFFLSIYVFAAFLKAQELTRKKPVEYLLNERRRSPDYCPWDQISENMKKYFILIEDPGFFKRSGTTLKILIRRAFSHYFEKNQVIHGSTISQQLAKNLYLRFVRSLFRKITEFFICLKIERRLTKEEIFTFYLNIIYYGNNIYGISNASEYYFSKKPAELTANQAVFFACLIPGPNAADPVHYPDTFFSFKIRKLEKCFKEDLISEKEFHYFCSFPKDLPDPEFAPAISRTEKPPVIRMENECFGPFHSHETE